MSKGRHRAERKPFHIKRELRWLRLLIASKRRKK